MEAICEIDPAARFELFTTVPPWFFQNSLPDRFSYHRLLADIGLVQKSPFEEDLPATLRCLEDLLPYDGSQIVRIADKIKRLNCKLVVCDIAPMGILIAQAAGMPSILVENFTWDWLYEAYRNEDLKIARHISYLRQVFSAVDVHIQTQPVCRPTSADLLALPISRKIRVSKNHIRQKMALGGVKKLVLITTGGMPLAYEFIERLYDQPDTHFIVACNCNALQVRNNLVFLPHHSHFFHPDLVNASDAVIGKAGYSTIAEVYHAGVPFGYIPRPDNREAGILVEFIEKEINGVPIETSAFQNGDWILQLDRLLSLPRIQRNLPNGAAQVAEFIMSLLA